MLATPIIKTPQGQQVLENHFFIREPTLAKMRDRLSARSELNTTSKP